jgi:hypothetical protein
MMSDSYRDRGLANATGADDCDKARGIQPSRQLENVIVASDHSDQAAGQVGVRKTDGRRRKRFTLKNLALIARSRNRGHEAIASPGQGRDVSRAVLAIAQRLAQVDDVEPQTAFFHGGVGPDLSQ